MLFVHTSWDKGELLKNSEYSIGLAKSTANFLQVGAGERKISSFDVLLVEYLRLNLHVLFGLLSEPLEKFIFGPVLVIVDIHDVELSMMDDNYGPVDCCNCCCIC
ncbi:hypothetical protein SAMD00019534_119680 [Acytostelium subglobosum LB1]|uniref:hypothetical protein n=1 Tax=Acytostelium subglobosum LB1 TaxID=1410327 RepID=UPI000644D607|nr:hypothetical protein SAMD00019534_119680 [Acytostelium subglobosum LB1]GAM28792.1 hypothetical protein SAMD00019534_119680 [Acytostelium subglobosum LB1]|eukprot:XP_012748347.1 hypothetical protein SAMD00019534_119680 [Acytostelium subglobosum LB1]